MRWAWYVVCGHRRGAYRVLMGKLREGDHLEDAGAGGRIILKRIFEAWDGKGGVAAWTWLIGLRWQAAVNVQVP
jgi:hypothetical protein